jgi:hypothetical protein
MDSLVLGRATRALRATAGLRLNADQAVVDGEIVALDVQGRPSFQALQHRGSHPAHQIAYYAFDSRTSSAKNAGHHPVTGDDRRSIVTGSYRSACRTRTRH